MRARSSPSPTVAGRLDRLDTLRFEPADRLAVTRVIGEEIDGDGGAARPSWNAEASPIPEAPPVTSVVLPARA